MDKLRGMETFVAVVECGSFTGAATRLEMSVAQPNARHSPPARAHAAPRQNRLARHRSGFAGGYFAPTGAPLTASFLQAWPEVRVELDLTNRMVDLVDEGIDLAIRMRTSSAAPGSRHSLRAVHTVCERHWCPAKSAGVCGVPWRAR
jgi:DNA-binding transcriptional LysR family regulator